MTAETRVVELARQTLRKLWGAGNDVGAQTRSANAVCRQWQIAVLEEFGEQFVAEVGLGGKDTRQRIDLVDKAQRIAYEMKVSPNNPHHEFYRDIFKVLVYNRREPQKALKRLIFLTPAEGAAKLSKPFVEDVRQIASRLGVQIKIEGL